MGTDDDGLAPYYGYYHIKVQQDFISMRKDVGMEISIYKNGDQSTIGRMDLISSETGEVWEVKPQMVGYNRNPVKYISRTKSQLYSYINGQLVPTEKGTQYAGKERKAGGIVPRKTIYDELTNTDITYWCEGDGIIWYKTSERLYMNPAPLVMPVPERSKSVSYAVQPNSRGLLNGALAILIAIVACSTGLPVPIVGQ